MQNLKLNYRIVLIVILVICGTTNLKAQWNQFCHFNITITTGHGSYFDDADFLNPDSGLYGSTEIISISSGNGVSTRRTLDGASNWTNAYGFSGPGDALLE